MHIEVSRWPRQLVANQPWRKRRLPVTVGPGTWPAHRLHDESAAVADRAVCEGLGKNVRKAATGTVWPGHR